MGNSLLYTLYVLTFSSEHSSFHQKQLFESQNNFKTRSIKKVQFVFSKNFNLTAASCRVVHCARVLLFSYYCFRIIVFILLFSHYCFHIIVFILLFSYYCLHIIVFILFSYYCLHIIVFILLFSYYCFRIIVFILLFSYKRLQTNSNKNIQFGIFTL